MKYIYIFLLIFIVCINIGSAQIELKKPVALSNIAYDSLRTFREMMDMKIIKGQEVCFMPLLPMEKKIGYRNIHTKVLEPEEMELEPNEMFILPKNKRFVHKQNPSNPYYTEASQMEMTKWTIVDVITKKKELEELESYSYLKLSNSTGETLYYFINSFNDNADNSLMLTGYFMKLRQSYLATSFITRRNVVLKDFYTGESFFSPKEEVWKTKDLILSMLDEYDETKPYLLLNNSSNHHIIIPTNIADEKCTTVDATWRFSFLNLDLKKKYNTSNEAWVKIVEAIPQVGMTKNEIMLCIGMPNTTFATFEELMKETTWEYLFRRNLKLRIDFVGDKARKIWGFRDEIVEPYTIKISRHW